MSYNPYDLFPLLINGKSILGRPFEFDSDVTNQKKMTNAFGQLVKPTKISAVCPNCGQGLVIDVKPGEPPFTPAPFSCPQCYPDPAPIIDPFINPLSEGRISASELDPLTNIGLKMPATSVAERLQIPADQIESPISDMICESPHPEPAVVEDDDIGEEVDLDDDFVEHE